MASPRKPRLKARVAIQHEGRLLCVLHAKPREEPFWCLPGGNVDEGETLLEGAIRELREEVGVEVEADGAILIVDGPEAGAVEVILRGTIRAGEAAIGADSGDPHLAEAAWIAVDELPATFRPTALRELLQQPGGLTGLPAIGVADWIA